MFRLRLWLKMRLLLCQWKYFLKCNISKKTSYTIGKKKFTGKICILNLRKKKRKSVIATVIIRYYGWKLVLSEDFQHVHGKNACINTIRCVVISDGYFLTIFFKKIRPLFLYLLTCSKKFNKTDVFLSEQVNE